MPTNTKYELKIGPATREGFGRALVALGRENDQVVVCDADLSKSTFTHLFAKEFPDRFISCGIAEANMVAIASGLAAAGKIAFAASFSAFVLNKGFEQLRVTAAYPNVPVKIVGTHSGISIGEDGPSQMSIEDLALACSLPGFVVMSPADDAAMFEVVKTLAYHPAPCFIRAGRAKAAIVYAEGEKFPVGGSKTLTDGNDLTIFAHGLMVAESLRAAEALEAEGIAARVVDMYSIKPHDVEAVEKAAKETRAIVVAEEHLVDGGLGVRIAQTVASTTPCVMEFVGIQNRYAESGTPESILDKYGLLARDVISASHKVLARKK
jgi:transketolase